MANKGLNMKDVREIFRLRQMGFSNRKIASALGLHRNTVNKYLESNSEEVLVPDQTRSVGSSSTTFSIDWLKVREEFLRGVPLRIIHQELLDQNKIDIQYSGFWKQAQRHIDFSKTTMVRIFKPGERLEIDYADGVSLYDPATGEIRKTQLFVGVLCHSRYTFAEFTWSQKSHDFLQSHVNMFNYFGGTTQVISPDNLKSAVSKSHRYDPVINQSYTRLAEHYGIAVVPARVKTPQDKAIVERTIRIFQRWFYMLIRHRTFTSLLELNQVLREHLEVFNQKCHRIFKKTRFEMFEFEKSNLQPLPESEYKVAVHSRAKLGRDCHFVFEYNYYSAPHHLRGVELDIWTTSKTLEAYYNGDRIALHARRHNQGGYFTDINHYPEPHRAYAEEDIQKLIARARTNGPSTLQLIEGLLNTSCPLKHLRRCQGILALALKYTPEQLELAAAQANHFNNTRVQFIEGVIKTQREVWKKVDSIHREINPHLRGIESIH